MAHIQTITLPSGTKTYKARWEDDNGEWQSRNFSTAKGYRKGDAQDFLDEIGGQLVSGTYIDPDAGRQTFAAFADEWAAAQDTWKASTAECWASVRKRLVWAGLTPMQLAAIDQLALKTVRKRLRNRYALSTTNNTMAWVAMVLKAAHSNQRIGRNPAKDLAPLQPRAGEPDGKVRPEDVPTTAEALAILAGAPVPYRAAIALGLAGLRKGEVLGLGVDCVDVDRRLVAVRRQLQRVDNTTILTTPKREKTRTIEVPPQVAFELRRHLRDYNDDRTFDGVQLVFQGRKGTPGLMHPHDFYRRAWRPALVAAGLAADRFKFHSLRHFCASSMLAAGADLTAAAGHLGDTVEVVASTYAHWMRDNRHVPAEVLERILAPAAGLEAAQ